MLFLNTIAAMRFVMISVLADGTSVAHPATLMDCATAASNAQLGITATFIPDGGHDASEVVMMVCVPEDAIKSVVRGTLQ